MKTIEQYIQLAIDNGYNFSLEFDKIKVEEGEIDFYYRGMYFTYTNLVETITSKEFIEAIARGLNKKMNLGEVKIEHLNLITETQAIAIRDNKLEEFITNLLPNDR